MATEITESVYILSDEEKNERNAMAYLKGSVIGYIIEKGGKYSSTRGSNEDFEKGLASAKPKQMVNEQHGWKYTRWVNSDWVTVRHIVHNRMRHDRPHTDSYESDQEFLKENWHEVKILLKELEAYNVTIPSLEEA